MAVIGKIRKHSGLLVIVVGIALAAFVLGDISKTQRSNSNIIGEVNGEEITYKEFTNRVEENLEFQKQQQGKQSLTPSESFFVREQTWNQFVNRILLDDEYNELGLAISKDELAEMLHGNNPHYLVRQNFADPQTGEFNPDRVLELLRTLNQMDQAARKRYYDFEQAIKQDQINTKFNNLIRKAYYVPESLAEKIADDNTVTASVKVVAKDFSNVADSLISFTEDDLRNYYKGHTDDYQLEEETRSVDYVVFEVVPSVDDRVETTELVNELFDEFLNVENPVTFVNSVSDHRYDSNYYKLSDLPLQLSQKVDGKKTGDFIEPYLDNEVYYMAKLMNVQYRPDSIMASHILIAYRGAQRSTANRSQLAARQLADSLWKVLKRNPSKFENIAKQFSDDPSVESNAGNLGWFADMTMVPEFNNAVLNAAVGEIVMVQTAFGYHVIEVHGKKNITKKYRLAVIDRAIEASSKTYQDYWTMASKFAAENTDMESFAKVASESGLNKRSFANMTKMTSKIYDLEYARQIVRWAFLDDTKIGTTSPIFDFDGKYIIAILTDIEEEGTREFERVKDLVEIEVRKQKKTEYILNEIQELNDFDKIAEKWNVKSESADVNFSLSVLGSHGREPEVAGHIFGLQKGTFSKIVGERGVYVVKLTEIKNPETTADLNTFKTQMASLFTNKIYQNAVINALKDVADIEENRFLFY